MLIGRRCWAREHVPAEYNILPIGACKESTYATSRWSVILFRWRDMISPFGAISKIGSAGRRVEDYAQRTPPTMGHHHGRKLITWIYRHQLINNARPLRFHCLSVVGSLVKAFKSTMSLFATQAFFEGRRHTHTRKQLGHAVIMARQYNTDF